MAEVSVVVGTFGHPSWVKLAEERAIPSVPEGIPVHHEHAETLAKARNAGLAKVETEWTIHLDADDELESNYVEEMLSGSADLRAPAVRHIWPSSQTEPEVPRVWKHDHACEAECLRFGNWCCIGTMVRTGLAREVGWQEFGWSEDWALFAGCWQAGGSVEAIPSAVYRAHHSARSRNRVPHSVGLRWHRAIEQHVFGEVTV